MTCKELIEYLSRFGPDSKVAFLVADLEKRLYYKIGAYQLIDEFPILMLEATQSGPLEEIAEMEDAK